MTRPCIVCGGPVKAEHPPALTAGSHRASLPMCLVVSMQGNER
jgi:hypothetical protein